MKKLSLLLFILLSYNVFAQKDALLKIMKEELTREMDVLSKEKEAPYFMSYLVNEIRETNIKADLGNIVNSNFNAGRYLTMSLRVGNPKLDNTRNIRESWSWGSTKEVTLPLDNDPISIKHILWKTTDDKYKDAVSRFNKVKTNMAIKVDAEDLSDDFTEEKPYNYEEAMPDYSKLTLDKSKWEAKLKKYSAIFLENPNIFEGEASLKYELVRKYFVSTEGTVIAQNLHYARLMISASVHADDGMILPMYYDYFAFSPDDLPNDEVVMKDVKKIVELLGKLRNAPVVTPYTGPALLSGAAAGVFFHEIFGHRVEGDRFKTSDDSHTFKKKVGEVILPNDMSVIYDPTLKEYAGHKLNGYYKYDDEGVLAQKVNIVENGVLKNFLMSRNPIEGFSKSNGHARADKRRDPRTRQSNLIVKTEKPYTDAELRKMLIEETKKHGLEYAYYFKEVGGGFTMTGRYMPNSFNVRPYEVYKVFVDGKPDELVRGVDLIGTPLSMFSNIVAAGNDNGLFTGMCGAESGWVPVSSVCPTLFVSKIELQKNMKSQDKPAILKRPDADKK